MQKEKCSSGSNLNKTEMYKMGGKMGAIRRTKPIHQMYLTYGYLEKNVPVRETGTDIRHIIGRIMTNFLHL